jgi:hypothetical protein
VDLRDVAKSNGIGRIALGAGLMLAPGLAARVWVGRDASRTGAKVLASALGARDVALGVGLLVALESDGPARGWLEGAALADAVDFAATLAAGTAIPRVGRVGVLALAGASAVQCALASRSIDD